MAVASGPPPPPLANGGQVGVGVGFPEVKAEVESGLRGPPQAAGPESQAMLKLTQELRLYFQQGLCKCWS